MQSKVIFSVKAILQLTLKDLRNLNRGWTILPIHKRVLPAGLIFSSGFGF
jgi:hypothetical protein